MSPRGRKQRIRNVTHFDGISYTYGRIQVTAGSLTDQGKSVMSAVVLQDYCVGWKVGRLEYKEFVGETFQDTPPPIQHSVL